mmetsp:Transcript_18524/g.20378  ORF Transcript_18524/g.20378 Transcript_18524/m.20378 type:complete len:256 (+) Transcript_18524:246-1013(+)
MLVIPGIVAEAVGILSISIFIALMAKHRKLTYLKIKYIFDNLELINKSKEHLNYISPYPNNTLSAEFGITEQIYLTNKTYKIEASFQHVYGHQDTKSRGEMSIEAVINVEADRLAGQYQDDLGVYSPITHMYPLSPAVFEINGTTITSNIRHHLIKAYAEPKYMRYLQRKNEWNRKTVQSIAWKCLNLGLKRLDWEVVLVKIYNNLLPTAATPQKWKWQTHNSCCLCGQSETRDHMLRCPEMSRQRWRIKTISAL